MSFRVFAGASLFGAIGFGAWLTSGTGHAASREAVAVVEAPAVVSDSALSREESLRRFRDGLGRVESLAPVARSREELVQRFARAVETRDSATLGALVLSRAEFGWLFYPTTPQGLPPYDLAPGLMWDLLSRQSDRGIAYVLRRHGGRSFGLVDHTCGTPSVEGDNRIWGPCLIRRHLADAEVASRLTGPIIERDGGFKFVSYTNDED